MLRYKGTVLRVANMLKKILSTFIILSVGLVALAIFKPALVENAIDDVRGIFINEQSLPEIENVLPINQEKKDTTKILSYFKNDSIDEGVVLENNNVIDLTNKERIAIGLPPLAVNQKLIASAKAKVNDMIVNQYFEHVSPTGVNVSDLGKKVGYDYIIMGENLALGDFQTDQELVDAWMASPGHRENILNKTYQEIGVYIGKSFYKNKEVWFAVQHFGTARSVCPYIDTALKNEIDTMNADLKKRGDQINLLRTDLESDKYSGEEYEKKVSEFNALVSTYNQLLLLSQQNIKEYNKQIASFNSCLSIYQKK